MSDMIMKGGGLKMNCGAYTCGDYASQQRSFLTKEEKIELLSEYKESLEKEAKGVAERISEMQKSK